mmetsp:Transcript_11073/g.34298  ORF Transcript_11073/g.34298 Transcript_11073/m.34298 type:complete len:220 (+) Transcript_11073:283-942(+)
MSRRTSTASSTTMAGARGLPASASEGASSNRDHPSKSSGTGVHSSQGTRSSPPVGTASSPAGTASGRSDVAAIAGFSPRGTGRPPRTARYIQPWRYGESLLSSAPPMAVAYFPFGIRSKPTVHRITTSKLMSSGCAFAAYASRAARHSEIRRLHTAGARNTSMQSRLWITRCCIVVSGVSGNGRCSGAPRDRLTSTAGACCGSPHNGWSTSTSGVHGVS